MARKKVTQRGVTTLTLRFPAGEATPFGERLQQCTDVDDLREWIDGRERDEGVILRLIRDLLGDFGVANTQVDHEIAELMVFHLLRVLRKNRWPTGKRRTKQA